MTQALGLVSTVYNLPITGGAAVPWRYKTASGHAAEWLDASGNVIDTATVSVDFSITPEGDAAANVGVLSLLVAAPATATALRVYRRTPPVQNYAATPGAEGVEAQLDRTILHQQELEQDLAGTLRVFGQDLPPLVPVDGKAIIWKDGKFAVGPDADDIANAESNAIAAAASATAAEQHEQAAWVSAQNAANAAAQLIYASRASLVDWASTYSPLAGRTYIAGGLRYLGQTGATSIPDLPGFVPIDPTPQHYGALGNGVFNDRPAFAAMDAAGGAAFIPKPSSKYTFSTPIRLTKVAVTIDPSIKWVDLTDSGKLSFYRGRATTAIAEGSNIHRLADRLFVGYGAHAFAGDSHVSPDGGTSWLPNSATGPFYVPANAGILYMSGDSGDANKAKNQPIGIASAIRSSDVGGNVPIGFGAVIVHDTPTIAAWGGISEIQRESGAGSVYGWEFAVKNKGNDAIASPNSLETGGPSGAYGAWFQGGGDASFGGAPANPSTAAIAIVGGASTWNSGIVMARDAITGGRAIDLSSETAAATAHGINWYSAAGSQVFVVRSSATDTDAWTLDRQTSGLRVTRNGTNLFSVTGSGNYVNGAQLFCGISGVSPQIVPTGPDANLDLQFTPKGTGLVRFGAHTTNADAPIVGYITIKDAGGTTRKLACIA